MIVVILVEILVVLENPDCTLNDPGNSEDPAGLIDCCGDPGDCVGNPGRPGDAFIVVFDIGMCY